MMDFERPLVQAVTEQFPETTLAGCLFHWKQALRRKLSKLGIPEIQMSLVMQGGMLDLLRVVPQHGINATICYLRRKIPEGEHTSKWDLFWDYFRQIWINGYDFELWNESEALARGIDCSNKTNNCLENLNRQINN
jgi:hypothetical protein